MKDWVSPVGDAELARLVVVSPHFDDAVMGAGYLLAAHPGSTVLTVMAGRPTHAPDPVTEWDAAGGFVAGDDVVALRRVEDERALAVLGATPRWLEFVDHQYDELATIDRVVPALREALDALEPTAVVVPFGLANPDHDCVHRAAMRVMDERPQWSWFAYEDGGYANLPGLLAWRIRSLFNANRWPTPAVVAVSRDAEQKRRALECYRSQLAPLRAEHNLDDRLAAGLPEQLWRLAAPPSGWERLADVDG